MTKRKRRGKRKKRRSSPSSRGTHRSPTAPSAALQKTFGQADGLIEQGRAREAVDLLEPLLASHPRVADVHYHLGYARIKAGDIWTGLEGYERAVELSQDTDHWLPLASLYLELDLRVHALRAFRQVVERQANGPMVDTVREGVGELEKDIAALARRLHIPVSQAEEGLYHMDSGRRALQMSDFPACIAASRRAIELLDDWPPPHNNLALALFFDGQPEEAIATERRLLSHAPDNVHALSNTTRFLAWTGQEAEARALLPRLEELQPRNADERLKLAEAAAALGEDERVFQLLRSLDGPDVAWELPPGLARNVQWFLAVAEANTGRRRARRRLRAFQDEDRQAGRFLAALEAGRPGPGSADRFPYFHTSQFLSSARMGEFVELAGRRDEMSPEEFRDQVGDFAARFPQIVRVAEKMIWENGEVDAGVAILETVATPAAYNALRRFGQSQVGDDAVRLRALNSLVEAGEIAEDTPVRVWMKGEWREVLVRRVLISDQPETRYTPQASRLLDQGLEAFQRGEYDQAERLFRRMLELEPHAREAYNNLGTIYARREDHAQAREMYQRALEVDPGYVFPRCNLAMYLLDEGDLNGAEEMLEPVSDVRRFHPQEMAFYSYAQARLLIEHDEYEAARRALQYALDIYPGYEPAQHLLERLAEAVQIRANYESFWEQQLERYRAARARLQAKLSTADPVLSEAVPLYTKNALTGMGHVVVPRGGWSALRKAELVDLIVAELSDPDNVERMVEDLTEDERAALRQVLARGGSMSWSDFDAAFGNDLEESPYWKWHVPETTMGRLRLRGLLVEATVDGELLVAVPSELRQVLGEMVGE